MAHYFDSHTHTHFAAFKDDWRETIEKALKNNVWMINVGTQKDTSARAVEVANLYKEGVYASVGLHPIHTEKSYHDKQELGITNNESGKEGEFVSRGEEFDFGYYKKLAENPKVVAIGECGLDYFRLGEETKERQRDAFLRQIELAKEVKKPLMIHCRNAFDDLIKILNSKFQILNSPPGVIHFFTGGVEDAKKLLDLGFSFTFGGAITYPSKARLPAETSAKAGDYDEAIKIIPLGRILSETDAPYVAPAPYRGKRNEPAYVVEVVKKLAELKNLSEQETADAIWKNANSVFPLC